MTALNGARPSTQIENPDGTAGVLPTPPSAAALDATGAVKSPVYTPLGYQQIVAATLANATPLTVPAGTRRAIIQAEAQAVRWRDDGTAPTTTVGMMIAAGGELRYDGNFAAIRFIAATAGAILDVSYYS